MTEAVWDSVANVQDTHYLIGSAVGPYPFPTVVHDFQGNMGKEIRAQTGTEDQFPIGLLGTETRV